jgi:hypothetical protein
VSADASDGTPVRLKFEGFTARIVKHEIDHLEGVLFFFNDTAATEIYTVAEEVPEEGEGGEPKLVRVPLTDEARGLILREQRPIPGHALHW